MKINDIINNYEIITETGCHLWMSGLYKHGYGQVRFNGKKQYTHRVAYEYYYGPIPQDKIIRHNCDVRCCINPEHLAIGTQKENMQDMVRRGRYIGSKGKICGEKNGRAKLTKEQICYIRMSTKTQQELADMFQVDQTTISKIKLNKLWAHIV